MSSVHLQVQNPDGTTRAFDLTEHDTLLLGRMKDCHLCLLDDTQVSRHHFLLEACPPLASLRDLGSMNGTHVNGKKCGGREKGETPEQGAKRQYPSIDLKHGDRITVGPSNIEVRIEAVPDVPGVRQVNAALPEGDFSGLSPEAMQQLIFGKPGEAVFQLKGYHIERELGRGGCCAIRSHDTPVVLPMEHESIARSSPSFSPSLARRTRVSTLRAKCQSSPNSSTHTSSASSTAARTRAPSSSMGKYVKPVSDVWSFAATLYHLLTGKVPYRFDPKRDPIDIILNENPVPIRDRLPSVEKQLAATIDKALVRNPKDRFPDAGKLLAAIR